MRRHQEKKRLDLALSPVLSTGAHAALPHPAHEEVDVGRPEGCHILGQAKLAPSAPELAQSLCIRLDRAVRLALYCAGCEVEGDELVEYWQVQPP